MNRFLQPVGFLARYGTAGPAWDEPSSVAYTRRLARSHYENFHVASALLPRRLRQDFHNVYSFCRWADDLGDEIGDRARSLELLAWWRDGLRRMYSGDAGHPVYVALRQTVEKHRLPIEPFLDLIHAFEQDQRAKRYATYDELLGYCRYSANPVGRLVLRLWGYSDAERFALADCTCTALQLANFWQDVARDFRIGRIYIPLDVMSLQGYSLEALEADLEQGRVGEGFRAVMSELVERTQALFHDGQRLIDRVDRRLAVDLNLFTLGGMAILDKIRRQRLDTISRRPKLGTWDRLVLLSRAVTRAVLRKPRGAAEAEHAYR